MSPKDSTIEVFQEKMACIEKKKAISYCQTKLNRGEEVDSSKLDKYIKRVMKPQQIKLKIMTEEFNNTVKIKQISKFEAKQIKLLYQKLAKLLHLCQK